VKEIAHAQHDLFALERLGEEVVSPKDLRATLPVSPVSMITGR